MFGVVGVVLRVLSVLCGQAGDLVSVFLLPTLRGESVVGVGVGVVVVGWGCLMMRMVMKMVSVFALLVSLFAAGSLFVLGNRRNTLLPYARFLGALWGSPSSSSTPRIWLSTAGPQRMARGGP